MENDNYGLLVEFDNESKNGANDFEFYFKIENTLLEDIEIKFSDIIYLTNKREEINSKEYFCFSGKIFRIESESLKIAPKVFKKIGFWFEKEFLKKSVNKDEICFSIDIAEEGIQQKYCFQKQDSVWLLLDIIVIVKEYDSNIKITSIQRKQIESKLFTKIERLEAFEERLGVSIQNLSISYNYEYGNSFIFFELHSNEGNTIKDTIIIECIFYDKEGSIIFKSHKTINQSNFFGFEILSFRIMDEFLSQINKIRLYPKKF